MNDKPLKTSKKDFSDKYKSVDFSSHQEFYEYYANESESQSTVRRFSAIKDVVQGNLTEALHQKSVLQVADIGCGAGTQSIMWAKEGYEVFGLDINKPLVELARERADNQALNISFDVGTADNLPWGDASMDVCLVPELLEHVENWEECLDEFSRILRPGGVMFLSTNNWLCPVQQEFSLPLYSWYPGRLKKYYEKLAVTTKPELVNYAKYPAVNWFSFYSLSRAMEKRGFQSLDRFDIKKQKNLSVAARVVYSLLRASRFARFVGHVLTPYTQLLGVKKTADG